MKKIIILSTIFALLIITKTVLAAGGLTVSIGNIWHGDFITVNGSDKNTRKPEIVTWGKMQSLAAKITDQTKRDTYFIFKDTELEATKGEKLFTKDELSKSVFYIVNGKAIIPADAEQINSIIIAVNKKKGVMGEIEFLQNDTTNVVVKGILYSAGDIKLNNRGVKVDYDGSLLFKDEIKEAFIDFSNWKPGN